MEAMLCAHLVLFADGVGAADRAEFWTIAGLERAAGPDAAAVRAVLYDRALPYFLHTYECVRARAPPYTRFHRRS